MVILLLLLLFVALYLIPSFAQENVSREDSKVLIDSIFSRYLHEF